MKTSAIEAEAKHDAEAWAAAEMFYGAGAGTRRKLLNAEIESKMVKMPGYIDFFETIYDGLDMTKYAEMAIKERKAIDRAAKAGKNIRAIKSGNIAGLSTGVYVVVGGVLIARATGYDKVIVAESKKLYKKAKVEIKFRKARMQGRNVEKIILD